MDTKPQPRGIQFEADFERFLHHRHIPVHHASEHEDRYQAIDLWVDGLAIQLTLGRWKSQLDLAKVRAKYNWTKAQSGGTAVLVVFDCDEINTLAMFEKAIAALARIKVGAKATLVLVTSDKAQLLAAA